MEDPGFPKGKVQDLKRRGPRSRESVHDPHRRMYESTKNERKVTRFWSHRVRLLILKYKKD